MNPRGYQGVNGKVAIYLFHHRQIVHISPGKQNCRFCRIKSKNLECMGTEAVKSMVMPQSPARRRKIMISHPFHPLSFTFQGGNHPQRSLEIQHQGPVAKITDITFDNPRPFHITKIDTQLTLADNLFRQHIIGQIFKFLPIDPGSQPGSKVSWMGRSSTSQVTGEEIYPPIFNRFHFPPARISQQLSNLTITTASVNNLWIEALPFLQGYRNNTTPPAEIRSNAAGLADIFILKGIIPGRHHLSTSHESDNPFSFRRRNFTDLGSHNLQLPFFFSNNIFRFLLAIKNFTQQPQVGESVFNGAGF